MKQLEEERDSRSDPDDPFNGTANGVFQPLQDPLSLPPPVQTPKRQGNNSEDSEHFQNSWENVGKQNTASRVERRNETVTPAQGEPREFREHSRELLDPMASIRNLHMQQRQNAGAESNYSISSPNNTNTSKSRRSQLDHVFTSCGTARCDRIPRTTQMTEKSAKEEFRMGTQSKTIRPQ